MLDKKSVNSLLHLPVRQDLHTLIRVVAQRVVIIVVIIIIIVVVVVVVVVTQVVRFRLSVISIERSRRIFGWCV